MRERSVTPTSYSLRTNTAWLKNASSYKSRKYLGEGSSCKIKESKRSWATRICVDLVGPIYVIASGMRKMRRTKGSWGRISFVSSASSSHQSHKGQNGDEGMWVWGEERYVMSRGIIHVAWPQIAWRYSSRSACLERVCNWR